MLGFRERAAIAIAASVYCHLLLIMLSGGGSGTERRDTVGVRQISAEILPPGSADTFHETGQNQFIRGVASDSLGETSHRKIDSKEIDRPPSESNTGFWNTAQYLQTSEVDQAAVPRVLAPLVYPEAAYVSKLAGRIKVRLFISFSGSVDAAVVLSNSTKFREFEEAAKAALTNTVFEPAKLNGNPVNSQRVIEVEFNPEDER